MVIFGAARKGKQLSDPFSVVFFNVVKIITEIKSIPNMEKNSIFEQFLNKKIGKETDYRDRIVRSKQKDDCNTIL